MSIKEKFLKLINTSSNKNTENSPISLEVSATQFSNLPDKPEKKQAIIGLDFGTAFTKAVVASNIMHHAVKWSVAKENPYLLAGVFYTDHNGICSLKKISEE